MSASAVTDPGSVAPLHDAAAKERPEVAAVLLQRLIHALEMKEIQRRLHAESSDDASSRIDEQYAFGGLARARDNVTHEPAGGAQTAKPALADELVSLLDRLCSGLYVDDRSTAQQRVLLALDGALPGAAAEIVRDGARLTIRLHARHEAAYRTLLMERDKLGRTLREHNLPHVAVEVAPLGAIVHAQRE